MVGHFRAALVPEIMKSLSFATCDSCTNFVLGEKIEEELEPIFSFHTYSTTFHDDHDPSSSSKTFFLHK